MAPPDRLEPLPKVLAAIAVVAFIAIYFFHSRAQKSEASDAAAATDAIANNADFTGPNGSPSAQTNLATAGPGVPQLDRARADAIREKLRELSPILPGASTAAAASANANGGGGSGEYPSMPDDADGGAMHDYIRSRIMDDYFPLAKSCYENSLAKTPNLSGRVVMKFKIGGDKRVGGVVEEADVDPSTTVHDEKFLECVKESMMSVSFDAPPNGGFVTVIYPITFSTDDGGGDSDSD